MGVQLGWCLMKQAWAVAEFGDIDSHCGCRCCALVVVKLVIAHIHQPVAYANRSRTACWWVSRGISIQPFAMYLVGLPLAGPPLGCFIPSTLPLPDLNPTWKRLDNDNLPTSLDEEGHVMW